MGDLRLRNRHRIREKDVRRFNDVLEEDLGIRPFPEEGAVDRADAGELDVLILDGKIVALLLDEDGETKLILSVRGLLEHRPGKHHVTVDMGAVPYVHNGADVMAPGIVDADPGIEPGSIVWVRDERNEQPLAVGRAAVSGEEMVASGQGVAVETLHHVGDEYWELRA